MIGACLRVPPCSDTVCDLGGATELANYGEYSGAPTEQQTYEYAKTILGLMTESEKRKEGTLLPFPTSLVGLRENVSP